MEINISKLKQLKDNTDKLLYNYNVFHRYFYLDNYLSAVIFQQKLIDSAISINNIISMIEDKTLLMRSNPIDINSIVDELTSAYHEIERDFRSSDFEFIYHEILELTVENIKNIISEVDRSDLKKIMPEIHEKIFDGIENEIIKIMSKFPPSGPDDDFVHKECDDYLLELVHEILLSDPRQKKTTSEIISEFIALFILINK